MRGNVLDMAIGIVISVLPFERFAAHSHVRGNRLQMFDCAAQLRAGMNVPELNSAALVGIVLHTGARVVVSRGCHHRAIVGKRALFA